MPRRRSSTRNDGPARTTLVAVFLIFIGILSLGWHRLLLEPLGNSNLVTWIVAIFLALTAAATARSVAQEQIQKRERQSCGHRNTVRGTQAMHISLLFGLSTVGSLSVGVYYGQGPEIVQESIDDSREALTDLERAAPSALHTPNYDRLAAEVNSHWIQLEMEIGNRRNCGDGPEAIRHIHAIAKLLPGFARPSGVIRNCAETASLIEGYRRRKDQLLTQSLAYKSDMVDEKARFRTELPDFIRINRGTLDDAQALLAAQTFDLSEAKTMIEAVANNIKNHAKRASALAGAQVTLEHPISLDQLRSIGSYWQTLPLLLQRLNHGSTYVILMLSGLLDLILVVSFARVLLPPDVSVQNAHTGEAGVSEDYITRPVSLWHEPPVA